MKIKSRKFGEITIEDDKIIVMPEGLPGFPGLNKFVILQNESINPFCWFQSIDNPDIALIIINPFVFEENYKVDVEFIQSHMKWDNDAPLDVYVVANVFMEEGKPKKITANLRGPIIVNTQNFEAMQFVDPNPESPYSFQHLIVE